MARASNSAIGSAIQKPIIFDGTFGNENAAATFSSLAESNTAKQKKPGVGQILKLGKPIEVVSETKPSRARQSCKPTSTMQHKLKEMIMTKKQKRNESSSNVQLLPNRSLSGHLHSRDG